MPENKTTGRKSIRYSFKYTNTTKRINKMKNNLKKSLVSIIAAMGICVTAAAGIGSAACAKQATETVNTAIVRGGTAVCTVLAVNQDDLDNQDDLTEEIGDMLLESDSEESSSDGIAGKTVSFETTDLDGNPVSSEELFRDKRVTMINFWATWCPYCVAELPELEKFNNAMKAHGCQVIGVCEDGDENAEEARRILSENGVTYTNLVFTENMNSMFPHQLLPTTYFVDSEGRILTEPVTGCDFEELTDKLSEAVEITGVE